MAKELRGNALDELDAYVPEHDDLFLVDEHFGLLRGATYKIICLHGQPSPLNEVLGSYGIQLGDWGMVPKEQRPQWRALMQQLGVGAQYWKDPDLLVPKAEIEEL